jgi:hypothetical protein
VSTAHKPDCCRARTAVTDGPGYPLLYRHLGRALYLVLGLACGAQAAPPGDARRSADGPKDPAPVEQTKDPKKRAPTPRPFVPTEKIKAGSAMSFPVDI